VQITSAMPIAKMVGSNRLVLGNGIVHVVGDAKLSSEQEREVRRVLVREALAALQEEKQE
jgi:predicted kinase